MKTNCAPSQLSERGPRDARTPAPERKHCPGCGPATRAPGFLLKTQATAKKQRGPATFGCRPLCPRKNLRIGKSSKRMEA